MGQRIRNISVILLKCAICNLISAWHHTALGAEMAIPPKLVAMMSEKPVLVATASQAADGDMMAVQTRNVDEPTAPTASKLERKSLSPLPSRKQRRRKPRMASVPVGSLAVAQAIDETGTQAVAQETRKPDLPTKPQITAQVTEDTEADDPFAPAKPPTTGKKIEADDPFAPARPPTTVGKTEADDPFAPAKPLTTEKKKISGKQYRMAPIRWRANVSEMISWLHQSSSVSNYTSTSSTYLQHTQTADINLSSYIMQPYIAQVNGGIGVVSSTFRGGGTTNTDAYRSNNLYGNGRLSLFPRSHFPFLMSFHSGTENQTRPRWPNESSVNKALNLQQDYSPLGTYSKYRGVFARENSTSIWNGNSSRTTLDGKYNTRLGSANDQPFEARALHTGRTSQKEGMLNTNIFSARHTYLPSDSLLTLRSHANLTATSQQVVAGAPKYNTQIIQASTVADWQPESEDIPLFVTGGGNILRTQTTTGGVSIPVTQSVGGVVIANYTASPNLAYSADGSVTRVNSGATSNLVTTQGGRASYRANPVKLTDAIYSWNSHGGIRNQTGSAADSGVFGSAGHALSGNYSSSLLSKKIRLRYGINQSLGATTSRINGQSGTLINGGTLAWSSPSDETLNGGASLSVVDTRTFGRNSGHTLSVLMNFGGAGQQGYGYKTSVYGIKIEADATISALYSQQRDEMGNQYGTTQIAPSARGSATYRKSNVFGVRRLVYSGTLKTDVLPKPPDHGRGQITWRPVYYDLTQALTYRIGMNEARLVGNFNEQHNGVKNASLFIQFMAWRTIGN